MIVMVLVYRSTTSFIPPEFEEIKTPENRDIELSDNEGISNKHIPVNIIQLETRFNFNP